MSDWKPKLDVDDDHVAACELMRRVGIKKTCFYDYREKGHFAPSFLTPGGRPRYSLRQVAAELAAISAAIEAAKNAPRPRRGRPPLKFNLPIFPPPRGGDQPRRKEQ